MSDHRNIGRVPAHERQSIIGAEEAGEARLELAVNRPLAGNETARRSAHSVTVDGGLGRR
jgi:hypothetical protein